MVKSKKASKTKVPVTSKVERKKKSHKSSFINTVKTVIGQYSNVFVLNITNLRTNIIKKIRDDFKDSKILFGKKTLFKEGLQGNPLADIIQGNEALLLTERTHESVLEELSKYKSLEFARTGSICQQTVKVPAQPLKAFESNLTPTLRDLGMPVELKDGVVILMENYQICKKGEQLTNSMIRLLKFFNVQIAEFSVGITAMLKDKVVTQFDIENNEISDSLPASVDIKCELLDDGKYYFIPHPNEETVMECE